MEHQFIYLEQHHPPTCINLNHISLIKKDEKQDIFYMYIKDTKDYLIIHKERSPLDYYKILRFLHCKTLFCKYENFSTGQWDNIKHDVK